jgi:uracil-DNA glycosylase
LSAVDAARKIETSLVKAIGSLPAEWREVHESAASDDVLKELDSKVAAKRAVGDVYPSADNVFAALRLTPYKSVRAVIIGQDPYHGPEEAHGLAFSVSEGINIPPSLRNIHRELHDDLGFKPPTSGSLIPWAEHGVLLLNAILTVSRDQPGNHRKLGWQPFTSAVVRAVQRLDQPIAFLLWGGFASKMAGHIDDRHIAVYRSHPSPFSAKKNFLDTRPFSRANALLAARGVREIDWSLS